MATRRSTTPTFVDGLAVYRREATDAASTPRSPVVLVHGSMDRAAAFRKCVRHLPELDVTIFDRRGYGRSVSDRSVTTIDALVADLLTVMDGRRSVLVGHSLGGVIALAAAERQPDMVASVGAFEAPMAWQPWWPSGSAGARAREAAAVEGPEAAAEQFMRRIVGDERWDALPPSTQRQRRREGEALLADLASMRAAAPPYDPARLVVPVVAGYGSRSHGRHQRASTELAAATDGELVVIDDAPHGAHYSHPQAFADFVRRVVEASA
jgi:pimeloyl-ACP methyl ester carboxylesterase